MTIGGKKSPNFLSYMFVYGVIQQPDTILPYNQKEKHKEKLWDENLY